MFVMLSRRVDVQSEMGEEVRVKLYAFLARSGAPWTRVRGSGELFAAHACLGRAFQEEPACFLAAHTC